MFSHKERLNRLRLIRSEHVGPVTFHQLMSRFETAEAAISALPELARHGGRRQAPRIASVAEAEREMARHRKAGAELVFAGEAAYPPRLAAVADAPPLLSVLGSLSLLTKKALAIVGARNASTNGYLHAEELAADLGRHGHLIVSGMARGIDAAAHRGALETGSLAVLGCGVDVVYPKQNTALYAELRERGAVVSELPPGTDPSARQFPRRNRIISGMARGVVVVEASLRSGSLITARLAADQGREVFAVPGAARDPRGRGTNALIRDGAVLTETAADVLSALDGMAFGTPRPAEPPAPKAPQPSDDGPSADMRAAILSALGPTPTATDDLVRRIDLPTAAVSTILLELELAGRLQRHPGNLVSVSPAA